MPVFESSRKVQVFGSSLAMTLPAMFVKACEIEKGSMLNVFYGLDGVLVLSKDECVASMIDLLEKIIESMSALNSDNVDEKSREA